MSGATILGIMRMTTMGWVLPLLALGCGDDGSSTDATTGSETESTTSPSGSSNAAASESASATQTQTLSTTSDDTTGTSTPETETSVTTEGSASSDASSSSSATGTTSPVDCGECIAEACLVAQTDCLADADCTCWLDCLLRDGDAQSCAALCGAACPTLGVLDDCVTTSCPTCASPWACAHQDADADLDGFTVESGEDCNDCARLVNPGAAEIEGNVLDDDCDAQTDELEAPCDDTLALDDVDPMNGARAIDLCVATDVDLPQWGVLSAEYVRGDGSAWPMPGPEVGLQQVFGDSVVAQYGASLLAMSSGYARTPGQTGSCDAVSCGALGQGVPPPAYPQAAEGCSVSPDVFDDVALELTLRVPTNAIGFQVLFRLYTFEYPEYVCDVYNDQFVAIVSPAPLGSVDGNIAFDTLGNPVSVNAELTVCSGCALGTSELLGTGFDEWDNGGIDDAGGTSWIEAVVATDPGGEITVRFAIWDGGDDNFDSTALIDGFTWIFGDDACAGG